MKHLTLLFCFVGLLAYRASAQVPGGKDTIVYGSIPDNYPGGYDAYDKYITGNVHYPAIAASNNVQGSSYVQFVIEMDGSLSKVKTCRGIGSGMDEEAVRLVEQSGKWKPSMINGKYVRPKCRAAVNFSLTDITDGTPYDPPFLYRTDY